MKDIYAEILGATSNRPYSCQSIAAPNRLETRYTDFFAAALKVNTLNKLKNRLSDLTGRQHIFFAPSCRAAIAQVLSLLPYSEVVLPAYTCPVVKTAIQIADKRLIYVDIAKEGLNSTSVEFAAHAKPGRVLIPTHIFGFSTDIEAICDLAKANDCITIEDAAASFGVKRNNRLLGTFGDVGVISFERSKRFPAFRGAAIIINNESILDPDILSSLKTSKTRPVIPLKELAFAMIHNTATYPWLYGRVTLPQILKSYLSSETTSIENNIENEKISPSYVQEFGPYQAALILRMLDRVDSVFSKISEIVAIYRDILEKTSVLTFKSDKSDDAGLLRFPVAFPGRKRSEILKILLNRGLFLETNFEKPLPEEQYAASFPNASWAAENLILLPLYSRLSLKDAERIAKEISKI